MLGRRRFQFAVDPYWQQARSGNSSENRAWPASDATPVACATWREVGLDSTCPFVTLPGSYETGETSLSRYLGICLMTHLPRPSDCNSGSVGLALMLGCQKMRLGKILRCDQRCCVPNLGWSKPSSHANCDVYVRCLKLCVCNTFQSERHTFRRPPKAANRHPYCYTTRAAAPGFRPNSSEEFCTFQASEEDFPSGRFYTDSFPHVHI